jgi:hypothetical protein
MIEADALLQERLAYTVPSRIPLSQFLAWPEQDQDLALAYLRSQRRKCPSCGIEPSRVEGAEPELIATWAVRQCCSDMETKQKQIPEDKRSVAHLYWMPREQYNPESEG